jgi:putative component of membrane protein insertase Oxa1/YidC/SpoIIIJ protein YidD
MAWAGYDSFSVAGQWLIRSWQTVLSPLQGPGVCNFSPSCSQFTKSAIQTQGFLPGVVIGADRLMRCNSFAWSYADGYYPGVTGDRLDDPVANHLAFRGGPLPAGSVVVAAHAVGTSPAHDTTAGPSPAFADYLFSHGEFASAACEYLRCRFSSAAAGVGDYSSLMAGESFLKSGDLKQAELAFADARRPAISDLSLYGAARVRLAESRFAAARTILDSIGTPVLLDKARTLSGWSYFKERRFEDGASAFSAAGLTNLGRMNGRDISRRSRALSALLSAALPGLGQLYSGRAGDAAYSFLTVVGSGLATWWFAADPAHRDRTRVKVSILGAFTALFYAGNVYGASISARDFNVLQERRYVERAEEILRGAGLEPDYGVLLDSLSDRQTRQP